MVARGLRPHRAKKKRPYRVSNARTFTNLNFTSPAQELDARHVESALESGCVAFVTPDKRDILSNPKALIELTGMCFFHHVDEGTGGPVDPCPRNYNSTW